MLPKFSVAAISWFPSRTEYVHRMEQGTLIEMQNEAAAFKRLNDEKYKFEAWVIAPVPGMTTSYAKSWLLLVKLPRQDGTTIAFPSQGDRFAIDMMTSIEREEGKFTLTHLSATRVANPFEDQKLSAHAAFKVDVPRSWDTKDGDAVEIDLMATFQLVDSIGRLDLDQFARERLEKFTITWDSFSLTYEAELAALHYFIDEKRVDDKGPSNKAKKIFRMIQDFEPDFTDYHYSLENWFPQLYNPFNPSHGVPPLILERFRAFNKDHRQALKGLSRILNGAYFINGCPGAGKTEWNMVVSALIQSRRKTGAHSRHNPILFVVDLNSTATDAADRYYNLCKAAGMNLNIIQMHGWPSEFRNSKKLNMPGSDPEESPDFTRRFMTAAGLSQLSGKAQKRSGAPNLDEAAWEYFHTRDDTAFDGLKGLMERVKAGESFTHDEWRTLRREISNLYRAVLQEADFIATTPVAAYGSFAKLFKPDVIFVDEAPHARELTTLIPLAYFDPKAWIFTGDVKQTRPFVKSGPKDQIEREGLTFNPYASQLSMSLMARVQANGKLNSELLINNRAYGKLHRLPSDLFYGGKIVSDHTETNMFPPSTSHLKKHLETLGGGAKITENRVVIRLRSSAENNRNSSFWNPVHHTWVIKEAKKLLADPQFTSLTEINRPGSLIIQAPYSTAFRQYQAEVKKWPAEWQERTQVLTVDKAQGNQADVVLLDMVRTTRAGFMDDERRLNVAITRARQAEIIVMHEAAGFIRLNQKSKYTSKVWDDAVANNRLFKLM